MSMTGCQQPAPAVVFAGVILAHDADWRRTVDPMVSLWGSVDLVSDPMPFDLTAYYTAEMGEGLVRRLLAFEGLVSADLLPELKLQAIEIEASLCRPTGSRTVNIDVGYLDLHRVVLASTKERPHKIYMGRGIWADLTLRYGKGRFHRFPWTFPDFADGRYDAFLLRLREHYKRARRSMLHCL